MNNLSYLVLRRMRTPVIAIIVAYAVCTVGLAIMPGVDEAGNPTGGMGLFTAFYVISYTGTTIGFGEIPGEYSTAQRFWMIFSIYVTVTLWTWAILTMMNLMREPGFQQIVRNTRFDRQIRAMREPFYIVCGTGETGAMVCHGLDGLHLRFVVIESDEQRYDEIQLEEFGYDPPQLLGDAAQPATLQQAGLMSPHCRGVVAVAKDDMVNQAIALNVKLLRPSLPVLARIRDPELDTHLGVFGGDIVINPFERFADHLASAIVAPHRFHLRQVLTTLPNNPPPELHRPPMGHWIMCGYGRFGHAIVERLRQNGLSVSVVDVTNYEEGEVDVKGRGTEVGTLEAAGIDRAAGIVVGNKEDQRNLAIAVRARELRPDIFVVTRQNQAASTPLFEAFPNDFLMEPSRLVAQEFLAVITTPLLGRFLREVPRFSEDGAAKLAQEIVTISHGRTPEVWSITARPERAALHRWIKNGHVIVLGDLLRHPFRRTDRIDAIPLMLSRGRRLFVRPSLDTQLRNGDRILFAGTTDAMHHQELTVINHNVLEHVVTGADNPGGTVFRVLRRWRKRMAEARASEVRPKPEPTDAPAGPPPTEAQPTETQPSETQTPEK